MLLTSIKLETDMRAIALSLLMLSTLAHADDAPRERSLAPSIYSPNIRAERIPTRQELPVSAITTLVIGIVLGVGVGFAFGDYTAKNSHQ